MAYYGNAASAVAIVVGEAERLASPVALRELNPPPAVPQSFSYISYLGDLDASGLKGEPG